MRSAILALYFCSAAGSSPTCETDADPQSLLQAKTIVRHQQGQQAQNAGELLKSMRRVASSFTKDSSVAMTPEDVNAAIGQASTALATMFPMLAQQHELAQSEIAHAIGAIEACHQQHGGSTRTNREDRVTHNFAEIHECEEALATFVEAEQSACAGQGVHADCDCTSARTAITDQRALCAAETERYGAVFCENQLFCHMLHECHAQEVSVYQNLREDLEQAMAARQQQYVTLRQTNCIMDLITQAMLSGTPIDNSALIACNTDIDVSDLALTFPNPPADPNVCHTAEDGEPQCEFDSSDLEPGAGSPEGCQCRQVQLRGVYSAGPVIRCDGCINVHRTTDQNSCPLGWKIFSPASQADWEVLHEALGDHSHHIANPANTPGFTTEWPASPWLIVDVSRSTGTVHRSGQRPAMNSANPGASDWHTSDGSPFWLREDDWGQPDGNYDADCFLDIFNLQPNGMGFDDHRCVPHSSSYLCQREDFYGQTADGCPRDNSNSRDNMGDQSGEVIATAVHTNSAQLGSVRCCSMDGSSCATAELEGGCHEGKTLAEAEQICAANDMRLCTEHEMADNVCCGTGCWFNHFAVWVTPSTLGTNPRADTKCPFQHDDRIFRSPGAGSSQITRAECFAQCQTTEGCNHYSWGANSAGNVCMGCRTLENAQHHSGFTAYDM